MPGSSPTPRPSGQIDISTGLPTRETASPASVNPSPGRLALARRFAIEAARSLRDDRCEDVIIIDLRGRSQVTDYLIIATGTSERQIRAARFHVEETGAEIDFEVFRSNIKGEDTTWIVLDFVDVVVHLFTEETRAHYDLEMMWGDAPRVDWDGDGEADRRAADRNRAGLRPDDVLE